MASTTNITTTMGAASRNGTTTTTTSSVTTSTKSLVRVPLSIHILQFVDIAIFMAALRVNFIANHVQRGLSILPASGIFAVKYAAGWFSKPLSLQAWVIHLLTLIPNLEMIEWLSCREAESSMCTTNNKTAKGHNYHHHPTNERRTLYRSLKYLFIVSYIQAIMMLMSHSLINVNNDELQLLFIEWEFFLMRIHVFSMGLLILLPGQWMIFGRLSWNLTVILVLPPLAWLVNQNVLTFDSIPGLLLSALSIIAILSRKNSHPPSGVKDGKSEPLPPLFKVGWVLLALSPLLFPKTSSDWEHSLGAGLLNIPLYIMAYGLNSCS